MNSAFRPGPQRARAAQQLLPVDPVRHDQVGEQQIDRARLLEDRERRVAVLGLVHLVSEPAQDADRDAAHRRAVFDHQDRFVAARMWRSAPGRGFGAFLRGGASARGR